MKQFTKLVKTFSKPFTANSFPLPAKTLAASKRCALYGLIKARQEVQQLLFIHANLTAAKQATHTDATICRNILQ